MAYEIKEIGIEAAMQEAAQYDFLLEYTYEKVILGAMKEKKDFVDMKELIEARFFSEDKEIHIFNCNGRKKAVKLIDSQNDQDYTIKAYSLSSRFGKGKKLYVKEYLAYDEDGQVYVEQTCLSGMEV